MHVSFIWFGIKNKTKTLNSEIVHIWSVLLILVSIAEEKSFFSSNFVLNIFFFFDNVDVDHLFHPNELNQKKKKKNNTQNHKPWSLLLSLLLFFYSTIVQFFCYRLNNKIFQCFSYSQPKKKKHRRRKRSIVLKECKLFSEFIKQLCCVHGYVVVRCYC